MKKVLDKIHETRKKLSKQDLALIEFKPEMTPCECHHNVLTRVLQEGGKQVFGWKFCICSSPNGAAELLNCAYHSVWRRQDGTLVDLTAPAEKEHVVGQGDKVYFLAADNQGEIVIKDVDSDRPEIILPPAEHDHITPITNNKRIREVARKLNRHFWQTDMKPYKREMELLRPLSECLTVFSGEFQQKTTGTGTH